MSDLPIDDGTSADEPEMDDRDRERVELYSLTVGEVWRESRVSCPHRDLLRAWRDGALAGAAAEYFEFHVREAQCPYCQANLDDFSRDEKETTAEDLESLRSKLLSSTMTILRNKREDD